MIIMKPWELKQKDPWNPWFDDSVAYLSRRVKSVGFPRDPESVDEFYVGLAGLAWHFGYLTNGDSETPWRQVSLGWRLTRGWARSACESRALKMGYKISKKDLSVLL